MLAQVALIKHVQCSSECVHYEDTLELQVENLTYVCNIFHADFWHVLLVFAK